MTILLSNSTVAASAARGTVIGTLSDTKFVPTQWQLFGSRQLFSVVGNQLVVAWLYQPQPGAYGVTLLAFRFAFPIRFEFGTLGITITGNPPPVKIVGDPASIVEVPLPRGV